MKVNSESLIEAFSFELEHCIEKKDNANKGSSQKKKLIAMPSIRLTIKIKRFSKILNPSIHESRDFLLCYFDFQVYYSSA